MRTGIQKDRTNGLTLVEILVIIALLVVLASFLFPILARPHYRHSKIGCVNNLKQLGLAFRMYADDNRDRYPMNISKNDEPAVNEVTPAFQYLLLAQNELGTLKAVICPDDKKGKPATDFINFSSNNISYFIGLDANENHPQSILAGDRNVTNGFPPRNGILDLTTNQPSGFTDEIHKKQGNIALGDGSVQQVSSARFRSEIIQSAPFATNRIKLP